MTQQRRSKPAPHSLLSVRDRTVLHEVTCYREVKKPAALTGSKLSKEEEAFIDAGGNEAAIGTDLTGVKHASQLDLWYQNDRTVVRASRNGKTLDAWSMKGSPPHYGPKR
jgi:hypothetical protein